MKYLLHLAQTQLDFRRAELQSLASLNGICVNLDRYTDQSPFLVVELEGEIQAKRLVERAILCKAIYELLGQGTSKKDLHKDVAKSLILCVSCLDLP